MNTAVASLASDAAPAGLATAASARFNLGLQGMRGIAILLVLLNHAAVPGFEGGFVGVDVFFVISGYLIGGLLLREIETHGRINLWAFYARRFRRLLPAFALVLIAVLCTIPWLYAPFEHGELMSSARASALYAANLWFASRATDYFGGHTEANPLLHLWSLAVEEQFYMFWPLFMLAVARLFPRQVRKATWWLVVGAGLLSLVACVWLSESRLQFAFFLTPMRIWEFAAGMLFVARSPAASPLKPGWVSLIGGASLLILAGVTLLFNRSLGFPGAWALLPVVASMGLLVTAEHGDSTWVGRLLRNGPLRWVGDCSYSLYLWHWPLMIFAALFFPQHSATQTVVVILLSLLLGWMSYRWVELPFKHGLLDSWSSARIVGAGLLLCVAMAAAAHVLGRLDLDAQQERYQKATEWPAATQSGCIARYESVDHPPCEFGDVKSATTVVLFGDSHAMQWFLALEALAKEQGWRLITLTKAQCPGVDLIVNYQGKHLEYSQCTQWREAMLSRIEALKPDLVLMGNSTGYHLPPEYWRQGLGRTLTRLKSSGLKLAYLRDTPFPGFHVPTCLARAAWRGQSADNLCVYSRTDEQIWSTAVAAAEARTLREQGVELLDLSDSICSQPVCPTERDGVIMFKDRNHITADFSLQLKSELAPSLQRLLGKL